MPDKELWTYMPIQDISKVMEEFANLAESHALRNGFQLDYSEASLDQVDKILGAIAPAGVLTPKTPEEESDLWTLSKAYGGYVGQVVIRQMGGQWELQNLPNGGSRVVLRCNDILAFPSEKVYKRLTQDQLSGLGGYCRALRAIIAQHGKNG